MKLRPLLWSMLLVTLLKVNIKNFDLAFVRSTLVDKTKLMNYWCFCILLGKLVCLANRPKKLILFLILVKLEKTPSLLSSYSAAVSGRKLTVA